MSPLTATTAVTLDGKDLGELGLIVTRIPGWRDVPQSRKPVARLTGRDGDTELSSTLDLSPRIVTVHGIIKQDTFANLKSSLDELAGRARVAALVRFIDNDDRQLVVDLAQLTVIPLSGHLTLPHAEIRLRLVARDPFFHETALTSVAISATPVAVAQGNGPVRPLIKISGAYTAAVTVTYKNSAGATIQTTQMSSITVAGGDTVEVDSARHSIEQIIGGVPTNIIDKLTGGGFIVLDPEDSADQFAPSPAWPTIELSTGRTGFCDYNKAYSA